ncbi:MAG: hypothetical protein KGN32_07285 [Burkholderiales bacterium]|nr:hypothetical protein [Burkholderiales bacterium]
MILKDGEAKQAMRGWAIRPRQFLGKKSWLKLLPFPISNGPTLPYLHQAGGGLETNPDGLYAHFEGQCVDLVAIEHCSSLQNFYDKRSRYRADVGSRVLALPTEWCFDWDVLVHGGQGGTYIKMGVMVNKLARTKKAKWMGPRLGNSTRAIDWKFPVRKLLVVYFLKPDHYEKCKKEITLDRHELFTTHSRLKQVTSWAFRRWLLEHLELRSYFGR